MTLELTSLWISSQLWGLLCHWSCVRSYIPMEVSHWKFLLIVSIAQGNNHGCIVLDPAKKRHGQDKCRHGLLLPSLDSGYRRNGVVARSDQGCVIAAVSQPISSCQDAEEAEAEAILSGLELGFSLKIDRLMVESDCANAVAMANNTSSNYSRLWSMYKNIVVAKSRCVLYQEEAKWYGA